jgi:hypothetical protein
MEMAAGVVVETGTEVEGGQGMNDEDDGRISNRVIAREAIGDR